MKDKNNNWRFYSRKELSSFPDITIENYKQLDEGDYWDERMAAFWGDDFAIKINTQEPGWTVKKLDGSYRLLYNKINHKVREETMEDIGGVVSWQNNSFFSEWKEYLAD